MQTKEMIEGIDKIKPWLKYIPEELFLQMWNAIGKAIYIEATAKKK